MERVPPRHRPHYPAVERLAILVLRTPAAMAALLALRPAQAPVRGRPGVRLALEVRYLEGRAHLPSSR